MLPTLNLPYAVRIDGLFRAVKTRAPRRQARPYPRLIDPLADQPESRLFARGLQSVQPPVQKPGRGGPSCKRPKKEKGNPARIRIHFRYIEPIKDFIRLCRKDLEKRTNMERRMR
jgi:hypothetical protein